MTLSEVRRTVKYWQKTLEPLGLRHWKLTLDVVDEPAGKATNDACVQPSTQYDSALIEFRYDFLQEADQYALDWVVIHELLHLIFRDLDAVTHFAVQEHGASARELLESQIVHETEGIVERLARTILALHPR